jgi:TolA-binding protein
MIVRLHQWAAVPLMWLLSSGFLGAQEVRRALPVETPEAVQSIPRASGIVPRALPVTPDAGAASILDQNINPAAVKTLKPEPTPTSPGTVAEPEVKAKEAQNDDEIRLAPGNSAAADSGDPAKTQLGIADGLYLRKMYDLAIPEYEKYLGQFEGDADQASATYRLAECYAKLGQEVPALNTYRLLIDEVGQGEFVGSAAFRLATRAFDRRDYQEAAPLFAKAYDNAKPLEVKITARYYQAKCLELMGRKADAQAVYEDVVRSNNDKNPYRDAANLSLAYLALENNQKTDALAHFDQLGREGAKPVVRAEALTRAGILASDLKQRDKAEQYFKDAIALNTPGKWKQVAQLELMKLQYDGDRFSQVLDSFSRNASSLNDETRPTVLLLVANSYRQLGKYPKALEVYNQLVRRYPDAAEATDARFQRLITLDVIKDPNLVSEVDAFLATNPARDRADKAKLLKAQALVQQNKYQAAAVLYLELGQSSLPDAYRADCCYAAGYSLSQVNDVPGAIEAFSALINRYPHYKMITKALLKRALLYQSERNYAAAIADFDQVISQGNPGAAPERETALLEKGLTLGQQQDYLQMSATFRQLLQEYPHSSGAAQANYWIGWAAFEAKRYADAMGPLNEARKLNPAEYGDKVALRLLFCSQILNRPEDAAREIDNFMQGDLKRVSIVADGCRWVGAQFYNARNFAGAAKYLGLLAKSDERSKLDSATWLMLGRADIEQKQFSDAIEAIDAYLSATTDPTDRAQGFLALGRAQLGAIQADAATKSAEQAMALQPEGRLNADARMLIGDIDASKGDYENAARSYLSVAVLYEDPEVTPHALDAAYRAFQKAGNQDQASKTLSELKNRYPAYEMRASAS